MQLGGKKAGYVAVVAGCFAIGIVAGWTGFGTRIDNTAYDAMFGLFPPEPWTPHAVVLGIDEDTLQAHGGMRGLRSIVAGGLDALQAASPKAVAIDMIFSDPQGEEADAPLEAAMRKTHNLLLPAQEVPDGAGGDKWEVPLARFSQWAAAIGHVHREREGLDGVVRQIPLEMMASHRRYWALALEAFRVMQGEQHLLESPDDLQVGNVVIPAAQKAGSRALRIRYLADGIPKVSLLALEKNPALAAQFRDKVVFLGVTALSGAGDRVVSPYGQVLPGVEVNAEAFETLAHGDFLVSASEGLVPAFCLALAILAGLTFQFRSGWQAYSLGGLLLVVAHSIPVLFFRHGTVFPYFAPVSVAWLTVAGAASYQHFVVRRQLRKSETEKARYQQAIHFVTHEMRTPLTAIQGSSELIGRYNLNDDKRKQIAQMINLESKRLARMIQTFLDVERLSDGQMELKRESFAAQDIVDTCLERVRPLAERKQIRIEVESPVKGKLVGDRELMEYAFYNLLTNAVKYSPAETEVRVSGVRQGDLLRLAVRDQGIGMDAKELRSVFQKFYRTKKAEASGEAGTGIGLSIVEQIVSHHGGRMEVSSEPGKGSCFTMVLPATTNGAGA